MDSVYKKLHDNFCAIPRCYIKFCMDIVKELKEGEDFNTIENFIEDLANFNITKEHAIKNFCHSGIDINIIDKLTDTLALHLDFLNCELDNEGFDPDLIGEAVPGVH